MLNDKLLWALTEKAASALAIMEGAGLDRDIAISLLEKFWTDNEIYQLPDADEPG